MSEEEWRAAWQAKAFTHRAWLRLRDGDAAAWLADEGVDVAESESARLRLMRWWGDAPLHTLARDALPARLARGISSPWVRVAGDPSVLGEPALAIVGTRRCACPSLRAYLETLVREARVAVVSGGASGVDTMAHDAALAADVPCIVVVAPGLGRAGPLASRAAYLQIVARGGAVLSEWPDAAPAPRGGFVRRNTHIAALAHAVLVARSPADGGAMHTARAASRLGVPLLALPGAPWDPLAVGPLQLVESGASLCTDAAAARRAMGLPALLGGAGDGASLAQGELAVARRPISLDAVQRSVVDAVLAGDTTVEALTRSLSVDVPALQHALLLLTLDGVLLEAADGYRPAPGLRSLLRQADTCPS